MKTILCLGLLLASLNTQAETVTIYVTESQQFVPQHTTVNVGDVVEFRHMPGEVPTKPHTVWSVTVPENVPAFWYSLDPEQESVSMTVTEPGEYSYYCYPHGPHMTGSFTALGATGVDAGILNNISWTYDQQNITLNLDPSVTYELSLISITGAVMDNFKISAAAGFSISIAGYRPDLYLLNIMAENRRKTVKVVKE